MLSWRARTRSAGRSRASRASARLGHVVRAGREAERQLARLASGVRAGGGRGGVGGADRGARRLEHGAARRRELDAMGRALEQAHGELALEPRDLLAQCGLRDVQALRRAPEVELLGEHHERPQQARVHARSLLPRESDRNRRSPRSPKVGRVRSAARPPRRRPRPRGLRRPAAAPPPAPTPRPGRAVAGPDAGTRAGHGAGDDGGVRVPGATDPTPPLAMLRLDGGGAPVVSRLARPAGAAAALALARPRFSPPR